MSRLGFDPPLLHQKFSRVYGRLYSLPFFFFLIFGMVEAGDELEALFRQAASQSFERL